MKKTCRCAMMLFGLFVLLKPASVYANELRSGADAAFQTPVVITSGIEESKRIESTFDTVRTIIGEAPKGTLVTIVVTAKPEGNSETEETGNYELTVGSLGVFSQTTDLVIGDNIIEITASLEDYDSFDKTYTIRRKDKEIKKTLEKSIVTPLVTSQQQ